MLKEFLVKQNQHNLNIIEDYKRLLNMESFKDYMNMITKKHDSLLNKSKNSKFTMEQRMAALIQAEVLQEVFEYTNKFISQENYIANDIKILKKSLE